MKPIRLTREKKTLECGGEAIKSRPNEGRCASSASVTSLSSCNQDTLVVMSSYKLAGAQYSPAESGTRGKELAGEGHGAQLTLTGTRVL